MASPILSLCQCPAAMGPGEGVRTTGSSTSSGLYHHSPVNANRTVNLAMPGAVEDHAYSCLPVRFEALVLDQPCGVVYQRSIQAQ